jgi:hypothetical protein
MSESDPPPITIEDEFIAIDVYENENLQIEKALEASSRVTNQTKVHQQKSLPNAPFDPRRSETDRDGRPFNPLRIRTRPKRKLLLSATPPSHPPPFTEPRVEKSSGVINQPIFPESGREPPFSLAPVPYTAPVSENNLFDIKVRSSSPLNAGMDHHGIDALLTRKVSGQTCMAGKPYANAQARTKNRDSTQPSQESRDLTGLEDQERAQFSHIRGPEPAIKQNVTRSPRRPLMLCGHTDGNVKRDCVSI